MRWILLSLAALPVEAQDWTLRPSDTILNRAEMQEMVIGATHEFHDGGQSFFSVSGSYSYTYSSGQVAYGSWRWPVDDEEGIICTSFRNGGFGRCDLYVKSTQGLVLLTEDGLRLPVRSNSADG